MQHNYSRSLVSYAKSICSTFKVSVFFGNNCYTDGKKIVVPRLPEKLNKKDMNLALADILHECGHILHSDFKLLKVFIDRLQSRNLNQFSGLSLTKEQNLRFSQYASVTKDVWNAIEDHYMELSVEQVWNGAVRIFKDSFEYMKDKGSLRKPDSLPDMLAMYAFYVLCSFRDHDCDELLGEVVEKLTDHFGNEIMQTLLDSQYLLVSRFPEVKNSKDGMLLALDFMVLFDDFLEVQDNKPDQPDDDPDGNPDDDSNGKPDENSDGNPDDDSNGKPDENSDGNPNDDSNGKSDENSDGKSSGKSDALKESFDPRDLLAGKSSETEVKDLSAAIKGLSDQIKAGESDEYDACELLPVTDPSRDKEHDKIVKCGDFSALLKLDDWESGYHTFDKDMAEYRRMLSGLPGKVNRLKANLLKLLQTQSNSQKVVSKRGKIKPSKLHRVGVNNFKVFEKEVSQTKPTASLSMLIDLSGSMAGSPMMVASQVLILLEQVLTTVGTPHAIYGFGDDNHHRLSIIKTFKDSSVTSKARLGSLMSNVGGLTPLNTALYEASVELCDQRCQKKVMFVITDGEPNETSSCLFQLKKNKERGIHTVFFVIGSENAEWLKSSGSDVVCIDDIEDLLNFTVEKTAAMFAA